jgi:hypothetical protein
MVAGTAFSLLSELFGRDLDSCEGFSDDDFPSGGAAVDGRVFDSCEDFSDDFPSAPGTDPLSTLTDLEGLEGASSTLSF